MISLVLLCLVRVDSAVVFGSGGVASIAEVNARRFPESPAEPTRRFDAISDRRFHAESVASRAARSPHNRDGSQSTYLSPLRRSAQNLVDSAWVYPPISNYLTNVVIPGIVINHGKVADLGRLSLIAMTHQFVKGGLSLTNLTVFHGNLVTTYKYNLDGPKGRMEVRAPSRIYSINLSSRQEGPQCVTELSILALQKEDELEFTVHGESSEDVNPLVKFLEHALTLESRRTAYFNIEAAVKKKLQTANPSFCQDIQ